MRIGDWFDSQITQSGYLAAGEIEMTYKATVVDLVDAAPDLADCTSEASGNTIEEAETSALAGSATNCPRRVYVEEAQAPYRIVKGPYIRRAD